MSWKLGRVQRANLLSFVNRCLSYFMVQQPKFTIKRRFIKLHIDVSMMDFHYAELREKFSFSRYEARRVIKLNRL